MSFESCSNELVLHCHAHEKAHQDMSTGWLAANICRPSKLLAQKAASMQDRSLADEAKWCREYAKVNAVALRKILEQHDKMLHNGAGQALLKVTACQPLA